MIRGAVLMVALLAAIPAAAQERLPALYEVVGISAGNAINVRSGPSTRNAIIAKLEAGAGPVQVVELNTEGTWAKFNIAEQAGWASMQFLSRLGPAEEVPFAATPLFCFGTEPFWSLELNGRGQGAFSGIDIDAIPVTEVEVLTHFDARKGNEHIVGSGPEGDFSATIARGQCSDGMTDQEFGLDMLMVLKRAAGEDIFREGCCILVTGN